MAVVISGPEVGGAASVAFTKAVSAPTLLVQITHGLAYPPAGVLCIDTQTQIVEPASINNPSPGVTEVGFGFGFTGTIFLS